MMTGATSLLSVTLVTTVSVNVLFVIVSVTLPTVLGVSGNSIPFGNLCSGFLMVSVTNVVDSGTSSEEEGGGRSLGGRKRAGIIA